MPQRPPEASADSVEFRILQEAANWFALLASDSVTSQDQEGWRRWLADSTQHRHAWARVEAISGQFSPLSTDATRVPSMAALQSAGRRRQATRRRALAGLAALGLGSLLGWAAWRDGRGAAWLAAMNADYRSPFSGTRAVTLPDGTRIWLNADTAFNTHYTDGQREIVCLSGEILVETAADPARPFTVRTADGLLRALGTRFTVKLEPGQTFLAVYEGAVEVRPADGATPPQVVASGQQLRFTRSAIGAAQAAEPARQAWASGVLLAEDTALGELVRTLSQYRSGYLGCDPRVAALRVTGAFPIHDTDRALEMLAAALPVRVRTTLPWWTTVDPR